MDPTRRHLLKVAEDVVNTARARLPGDLRPMARAVPVVFEPWPSDEMVADGLEKDILGLFVGASFPEGETGGDALPPQILIFIENIWDYAEGDEAEFRREVRTTYLHEFGHFLGWNEDDLEARGLG